MKKMNKKAQTVFVGIMIAVVVFVTAVVMIEPIKDFIDTARSPSNLDCDNSSINVYKRGTCVLAGMYLPYFFGVVVLAGAAYVTGASMFD